MLAERAKDGPRSGCRKVWRAAESKVPSVYGHCCVGRLAAASATDCGTAEELLARLLSRPGLARRRRAKRLRAGKRGAHQIFEVALEEALACACRQHGRGLVEAPERIATTFEVWVVR